MLKKDNIYFGCLQASLLDFTDLISELIA